MASQQKNPGQGKRRAARLRRQIAPPQIVLAPAGVAIRTRLVLCEQDRLVLLALGDCLTPLANADLARAVAGDLSWKERKALLTPACSSRWAGTITRENNDAIGLARRNLLQAIESDRSALRRITRRLARPIMTAEERKKAKLPASRAGYESRQIVAGKKARRDILAGRLARHQADLTAGHLSICRGGRKLLNTRHDLADANLTEEAWRGLWVARRRFLSANGETGKKAGNETIRVSPEDGSLTIDLPSALAHLSNRPSVSGSSRYRLEARAVFSYRGDEWRSRAISRAATSYRIWENAVKGRWYLDASWTIGKETAALTVPAAVAAAIATAVTRPVIALAPAVTLGIDLNADHIACVFLDAAGNPVGRPVNIGLDLADLPSATRDGRIRAAISAILRLGQRHGICRIAVENLNFGDSTSREKYGHQKHFRGLISGFPTTIFRSRLAAMCGRAGIILVAVDPAYTSRWGAEHWLVALHTADHQASGHEAAAVVIGRRADGYGAPRQRNGNGEQCITAEPARKSRTSSGNRRTTSSPVTRTSHPLVRGRMSTVGQPSSLRGPQTLPGQRNNTHPLRGQDRLGLPRTFRPTGSEDTGGRFVRF